MASKITNSIVNPEAFLCMVAIGHKKAGKSVLIENLIEAYYELGFLGLDWWSPRNFENLFYCIGKNPIPITLIHPPYSVPKIPQKYKELVKPIEYGSMGLEDILRVSHEEKRICCFDNSSFKFDDSYEVISKMLYELCDLNKKKLHYNIILSLREVSSLLPSYLQMSEFGKDTRKALLQLIKEARHNNITLVLDTQKFTDIFNTSRDNLDAILIKKSNVRAFPEELGFFWDQIAQENNRAYNKHGADRAKLLRMFPPINQMDHTQYYTHFIEDERPYPVNHVGLPKRFSHKEEKDNFCEITGIQYVDNDKTIEHKEETKDNKNEHYEKLITVIKRLSLVRKWEINKIARLTDYDEQTIRNILKSSI